MDKDLFKGFKIGIGFLGAIFITCIFLFSIVYAVGFHTASEILPGVFSGNYSFINGNVGIGTSSSSTKLEVQGSTLFNGTSYLGSLGAGGGTTGTLNLGGIPGLIDGYTISNSAGNYLKFSADSSGTAYMVMSNLGNIGIGTTIPNATLDVVGEIKVGNSNIGCSNSLKGSLRYNLTTNTLQYCNSTSWNPLSVSVICSLQEWTGSVWQDTSSFTVVTGVGGSTSSGGDSGDAGVSGSTAHTHGVSSSTKQIRVSCN